MLTVINPCNTGGLCGKIFSVLKELSMPKKLRRSAPAPIQTIIIADNAVRLGRLVQSTRQQYRMSQTELSRAAGVSLRSIVRLELGERIRAQAIAHVAIALHTSAEEWVKIVYPELDAVQIQTIVDQGRGQKASWRNEMSPLDFFLDLQKRMKQMQVPALLVASVASKPLASANSRVFDKIVELLESGMCLALTDPFPTGSNIPWGESRHLSHYYAAVENWIYSLIASLKANLSSEGAERVVAFRRKIWHGEKPLVQPPLRLGDTRPVVVQFGDDDVKYVEFSVYVKRFDQDHDQWIVFDANRGSEEERERTKETTQLWCEYYSEILHAWHPSNKKHEQWNLSDAKHWEQLHSED